MLRLSNGIPTQSSGDRGTDHFGQVRVRKRGSKALDPLATQWDDFIAWMLESFVTLDTALKGYVEMRGSHRRGNSEEDDDGNRA